MDIVKSRNRKQTQKINIAHESPKKRRTKPKPKNTINKSKTKATKRQTKKTKLSYDSSDEEGAHKMYVSLDEEHKIQPVVEHKKIKSKLIGNLTYFDRMLKDFNTNALEDYPVYFDKYITKDVYKRLINEVLKNSNSRSSSRSSRISESIKKSTKYDEIDRHEKTELIGMLIKKEKYKSREIEFIRRKIITDILKKFHAKVDTTKYKDFQPKKANYSAIVFTEEIDKNSYEMFLEEIPELKKYMVDRDGNKKVFSNLGVHHKDLFINNIVHSRFDNKELNEIVENIKNKMNKKMEGIIELRKNTVIKPDNNVRHVFKKEIFDKYNYGDCNTCNVLCKIYEFKHNKRTPLSSKMIDRVKNCYDVKKCKDCEDVYNKIISERSL